MEKNFNLDSSWASWLTSWMRTLIISDIHQRIHRAQAIIESVPYDKVVLLGDYFDSHTDPKIEHTEATAVWLKEYVLPNPKIVPLIGNHDNPYFFRGNPHMYCSGFTAEKSDLISNHLGEEDFAKFKLYHIDQNHVLSHAGLTNQLWKTYTHRVLEDETKTKLEYFDEVMAYFAKAAIDDAKAMRNPELFGAGWDRGGYQRNGGINWVDWRNFAPINGINQIVGHSIHKVPEILLQKEGGGIAKKTVIEHYELLDTIRKHNEASNTKINFEPNYLSVSYAIDTCNNHYVVIEDGVVNIYDFITRINLKDLGTTFIPESSLNNLS